MATAAHRLIGNTRVMTRPPAYSAPAVSMKMIAMIVKALNA
jgi:hypothetical protein